MRGHLYHITYITFYLGRTNQNLFINLRLILVIGYISPFKFCVNVARSSLWTITFLWQFFVDIYSFWQKLQYFLRPLFLTDKLMMYFGILSIKYGHFLSYLFRYSIVQSNHADASFSIDAHTGLIITKQVLDREEAAWHNITVMASEIGKQHYLSQPHSFSPRVFLLSLSPALHSLWMKTHRWLSFPVTDTLSNDILRD